MKILYLEDNPLDADLTALALRRTTGDFELDHVQTMESAFARLSETPRPAYDVVLTDLNVPDGTGLDLLAFIRSNGLPYAVVVVTGDIEEETILAALKAGADYYIIKREDYLDRLPDTLETALELYHSQTARKARPIHVLYAENNPADIELTVQHMLKNAAHIQITTVSTPRTLFDRIAAQDGKSYDVILLEYMFSGTTGLEILKTLNFEFPKLDTPVVFVTGQGNEDILLQATRLGAADYVTKETGYLFRLPGVIENAFHRAQMIREQTALQRRLQELTVLHTIAMESTRATSVDEIIEKVTQTVGETLYPDNFGVLIFDKNRNALILHPSYRGVSDMQRAEIVPTGQGITGQAFQTRLSHRIENVKQHVNYIPFNNTIHSELAIPIFAGDQAFGVINVESDKSGFFSEEDEKLLVTVASQLGIALEKIRLLELERQRLHESEILRTAAAIVTSSLDMQYVLDAILDSVGQVVPFDSASIFLIEGADTYRVVSEKGASTAQSNQLITRKSSFFDEIKRSLEPMIIADVQAHPSFEQWGTGATIRAWMGVPLIVRDEIIGFLTLDNTHPDAYNANDAALAKAFAYQAATAINNAQLYQETRQRLRELELVNRISTRLRVAQTTQEIIATLLDETLAAIHAEAGAIWLFDATKRELNQSVARGWFSQLVMTQRKPGEGFAGKMFASNEIYKSEDFSRETVVSESNRAHIPAGWSLISLPIRAGTQPIGLLFVSNTHRAILEDSNVNLLKIIAEIAGNAIHRATLHHQTEKQLQQLTALRDIDVAISSSFDLNVTLDILLDHTMTQLHSDAATILLYNPNTQRLELAAARGLRNLTKPGQINLRMGESYAGTIALKREPLTILNIPADPHHHPDLAPEGFIFYTGIPLLAKGQLQGVFEVFQRTLFNPTSEWFEFLNAMSGQAAIAIDNTQLFNNLQRANMDLTLAYDTTLEGWGKALELRDRETEGHTLRVTDQTIRLALALGISDVDMIHLRRGALLHDIGKMGIPDSILHKPGPLTDEEFAYMKKHPGYAYELLHPIEFLRPALDIPYGHHEKWDGTGYPLGLKGEEIPKSARIFALIDVWDALRSDRVYRAAWPKEKVVDYIQGLIGKQFDPTIAQVFLQMVATGQIS